MDPKPLPIRGRGAAENPAGRFERLSYDPDPDAAPDEEPAAGTQFYRDQSRSIIAYNDSPDIIFGASINPYRGCEHGCSYCMAGETPILMADGSVRSLEALTVGDAIFGTVREGWYRRYRRTEVLAHWRVKKPAYRILLEDGTTLIAGSEHRFLTERGWKYVADAAGQRPHLTPNNKLMGVGALALPVAPAPDYAAGYLCGMIRGDAMVGSYYYPDRDARGGKTQHHFRLALADRAALDRTADYLQRFEISTNAFIFQRESLNRRAMVGIRTHSRSQVESVKQLLEWPTAASTEWQRGFLAGIFDAEGSCNGNALRIHNSDQEIIEQTRCALEQFGFTVLIEHPKKGVNKPVHVVRMRGGLREQLRFFQTVDPAITRKLKVEHQAVKSSAKLKVVAVESLGQERWLFDITTGTEDFIANGVVSHNCYARPYHEYLGLSPGLDFETKILVKEDAPQLLRKEMLAKKWQPQLLGLSGVTDCYQPVERRLELTRRCLEVLAEFRNPVSIVTKNALVARDADVLGELARHECAMVFLSITTLDADLAGILEPRAARPHARLAAITTLANAGVPVGVLAAPIIPGLNDHEIPAIIAAAAQAGARFAGWTLLRLPLAVDPLFTAWLERHFPQRKDKILGRIRDMRGGKLNASGFGDRMRGKGPLGDVIGRMFDIACQQAGMRGRAPQLVTTNFRRPGAQRSLFDE